MTRHDCVETQHFLETTCFFGRPGCLGFIMKSRVSRFHYENPLFRNDKFISNFNNIQTTFVLQCLHAHIRWESMPIGWSRKCSIGSHQARNQLGTLRGAKSFLRGAQIFWTMSNSFKIYPTNFSRGGAKIFLGGLRPPGYRPILHPHIRSLLGMILLYLMPTEENGETRVRVDCLNFDLSLCIQTKKTNFNYENKALGLYFCGILQKIPLQFNIAQLFRV